MAQYIEPNLAMAMQYSNQQGMNPSNRYSSGVLGLKHGGRPGYKHGAGIGGGRFKGHALPGGRTGYAWYDDIIETVTSPLKPLKKVVKKLIPKELAGIMQIGAPIMAGSGHPWAAAMMSAAGQYKQRGKINPLQLAMSTAPGWTNQGVANLASKIPGVDKANVLKWLNTDAPETGNFLRSLLGKSDLGQDIDYSLFDDGILGTEGKFMGGKELLSKGAEKLFMTDGELDKTVVIALGLGGMSYLEAKKQMQLMGKGDLENDYGITEEEWVSTDWTDWAKGTHLEGKAQGGRVGKALGGISNVRPGYLWGSDKGEGLGGEEVEADMRFTGGFMPYGEEPKADDVPARLSKDEFVFTDEAVKGAGQGDVNAGAERLFNIMKQLEQQGSPGGTGIGAIV